MAPFYRITIDQGSVFDWTFELPAGNYAGSTPYAALKREYFTSDDPIPFEASISNTSLTISLTDVQTSAMAAGIWVYDVILVSAANVVTRVFQGYATVTPRVTPYP